MGFLIPTYIKYSKFWSVSQEHFIERKPLISEESISLSAVFSISLACCAMHMKRLTQTMTKSRQVQALVKYRHRPKAIHLSIISMKKSTANTKLTIFRINISWVMSMSRGGIEKKIVLLWKCFHVENRYRGGTVSSKNLEKSAIFGRVCHTLFASKGYKIKVGLNFF